MPTYEFECPAGHEFEKFFRKISGSPTHLACPECGQIAERKVSGGGGLIFKGSGFYVTDYRKDGNKEQAKRPTGGEAGGASSDASSSESGKSESSTASEGGAKQGTSSADEAKPVPPSKGSTPAE